MSGLCTKISFDLKRSFLYTQRTMFIGRLSFGGFFRRLVLGGVIGLMAPGLAYAKLSDAQLQAEVAYATDLIYLGFPDYSNAYLEELVSKHGVKREQLISVQVNVLVTQKKFEEALTEINKAPAGQARDGLMLVLADGYYAWGMYKEAREVYTKFCRNSRSRPLIA